MIDFKEEITKTICSITKNEKEDIKGYIEVPKDTKNGDFAFPCFSLAKTLKKAPQIIANELKEKSI